MLAGSPGIPVITCKRGIWTIQASVVATVLLAGCKSSSDLVELRLHPCTFGGELPGAVHLEIQGFDGAGEPVGERREEDFTVPDGAFDDDYATVGYDKPDAVVSAELVVGWYRGDVVSGTPDAELVYDLDVPAPGGVLDLSSADCPDDGGTDTTTDTSTDDGGGTSGTTSATSESGTQTTSDDSTATGTATTATATTSGTATSGTATTTGTTGLEGTACTDGVDTFVCEPLPDGGGKLLECITSVWTQSDDDCPTNCGLDHPQAPTPAGCLGDGEDWVCLCTGNPPVDCTHSDQGCIGDVIVLCIDETTHLALCPGGCTQPRVDEPECAF